MNSAGVALSVVAACLTGLVGAVIGWMLASRRLSGERGRGRQSDSTSVSPPGRPDAVDRSNSEAATRLLSDVVAHHQVGVVVVDQAGSPVVKNQAAARHEGTHVGALLSGVVARHMQMARGGVASGETVEIYGPPQTALVVNAYPLARGGAVAFIADVSDQRRTDQIRTDFVANISHELKTPIGAIAVLAEALEGETDPAVVARLLTRLQDETDRAAHTIDDLMELSRLEIDNEQVLDTVDVSTVVKGALARVSELAAQAAITVTFADAEETSADVRGDRRQLTSAVGNLVENAVKYSEPNSEVVVRVTSTIDVDTEADTLAPRDGSSECGTAMVGISVIDHGIGIPARDIPRIFERFYRVDRARSRGTGGSGLGLSIVRHIASRHAGRVDVESQQGHGSTFTLWLPSAMPGVSTDQRGAR